MFSSEYTALVLDPAYRNWKRLYATEAMSVHRAHLVGLFETGIVDGDTARSLARAIDDIEREYGFPDSIPAGVEDLYFVFERELERRLGADTAAYLHIARSRNDMDTTVFRMRLRGDLLAFCRQALGLVRAVVARAVRGTEELTVLYTHGQPANVSTVEHYLTAFAADLVEDLEVLVAALETVNRSTMGACAITGTGFPLDRGRVAGLLGFPSTVCNTYQAISTSRWLTFPASALEGLLGDCARFVADLGHKASCEVGLVVFPDSLVQVSSIMPQKRNPVILEHARLQAGLAMGGCAALRDLYRNVPYQDVNEAADGPVSEFLSSLGLAGSVLRLVAEIVENFESSGSAVRRIARDYGVTTTELADTLVRQAGVGFRTAHAAAQAFVRAGNDPGALRESFLTLTGRPLALSDGEIREILTPERFVRARKVEGGPAREGMRPVHAGLGAAMAAVAARLDGTEAGIAAARGELASAWGRLGA